MNKILSFLTAPILHIAYMIISNDYSVQYPDLENFQRQCLSESMNFKINIVQNMCTWTWYLTHYVCADFGIIHLVVSILGSKTQCRIRSRNFCNIKQKAIPTPKEINMATSWPLLFIFNLRCIIFARGGDCLLLFADYKLRSIYKSWKAQLFGIRF